MKRPIDWREDRSAVREKVAESAHCVLPIVLIVVLLCLAAAPMKPDLLLSFLIGGVMLVVGMGLFSLGAEQSMTPIGTKIGTALTRTKNLPLILGVEAGVSLGQIREEIAQAELRGDTIPKSMTKADYAEYRFESALAEEDDFDMLVMGRTQGKGCYCYVNGVLKTLLDKYIGAYRYVVIDNEAGMEHIARGTLPHVDALLLVSDCSRRGVQAVARIAEMVRELDLKPGLMKLIINRAPGGVLSDGVREEIEAHHLELAGVLPQDDAVYEADCDGKPSSKIPDASPVKRALHGIMQDLSL